MRRRLLDGGQIPILPYTRPKGKKGRFKLWEYTYDEAMDVVTCLLGPQLRHTTTSKEGKRIYHSTPKECRNCPCRERCGANAKGQKIVERHIWQKYLDVAEQLRKTELGREIYTMRYTRHRGLTRVRLKFATMNLKKLAIWSGKSLPFL